MKHSRILHIFLFFVVGLLLLACESSAPGGILSHDEMEDVLYDMHLAQALYESREGDIQNDADILSLRANVLKKHGLDQAEWDSSFNYYCRNAQELQQIYENLSMRIERNIIALGGKVDGIQGEDADTANVWKYESSFILMHQSPYNVYSYEITPDSTFEDGDRISLQFDTQMLFQDGYRDIVAFMAVHYSNDSIATSVTHTNSDGHGIVLVNNDVDRLHVTKIRGYFLLAKNLTSSSSNANSSTMRLASIRNVKLLHLHTAPPASQKPVETPEQHVRDSIRRDSIMKDSIMKSHPMVVN